MSDHDIIQVTENLCDSNGQIINTENEAETDQRQPNFHHEKVSWKEIKELIKEMTWKEGRKGSIKN